MTLTAPPSNRKTPLWQWSDELGAGASCASFSTPGVPAALPTRRHHGGGRLVMRHG